jgi:hypothetical protein
MNILKHHKIFLLIAAIGFAYRLFFAWHSISQGILIADDAYYYFTIARNMIAGLGPTFDCLAPTNGFHPLWLLVLLPLYKFFGFSLWLPIQMAMSLIAIFDLISGIVIYKIFDDKGYRNEGLIASVFWFLSAFTVFTSTRGMEVSLAVMLALLLFRSVSNIFDSTNNLTMRSAIAPGILLGLSTLARTDYLFLLGIPTALLAIYKFHKTQSSRAALWLISLGAIAFFIILPWLIWNYSVFGSITQVSGAAKMHYREHFGVTFAYTLKGAARWFVYNVMAPLAVPSKFLAGEDFQTPRISILVFIWAMIMALVPAILFVRSNRCNSNDKMQSILLLSTTSIIAQVLLYGIILRLYAAWYALLFFAILSILLGAAIPEMFKLFSTRKSYISALIGILIVFNLSIHPLFLIRGSRISIQPENYYGETLREIAADYPDGARVGAFNAGAIGYIAPRYGKLTVINLDCLVNNQLFKAAGDGNYLEYITDNIDILFEDPQLAFGLVKPEDIGVLGKIYIKSDRHNYWEKNKLQD